MAKKPPKGPATKPPVSNKPDLQAPHDDYLKSIQSAVARHEKLLAGTNIPNLPDYEKLFGGFKIPELPDYSKLFAGIKISELPDYERLFAGFKISDLPDYTKLFTGFKIPDLADYGKLRFDFEVPNLPDYGNMPRYSGLLGTPRFAPSFSSTENRVPPSGLDQSAKLREEIEALKTRLAEHGRALGAAAAGSKEQEREIDQLKAINEQLREKERLGFLLDRVHPDAHQRLLQSHEFQNKFLATGECPAFVLSVDIRRSTELMLKARTPEHFADFIGQLCLELTDIVLRSFGVFDKFTGDGILAFFPDFYSEPDAAYRVVRVADECHAAFERHYRASRTSFKSVLADVGLGIGIDHGLVRLVRVAGGLTVVGEPVVYACRLSSGPAKMTLVNQPAFEQIIVKFGGLCFIKEHIHEIKHEGATLAYDVRLNGREHLPTVPAWLNDSTGPEDQGATAPAKTDPT